MQVILSAQANEPMRAIPNPELIPFFEWISKEMAGRGIDWRRGGTDLAWFLRQVEQGLGQYEELPAVAAENKHPIKEAQTVEAPVEEVPAVPEVSPTKPVRPTPMEPVHFPSMKQHFPKGVSVPKGLNSEGVRFLLANTRRFIIAMFIYTTWQETNQGPSIPDMKAFLRGLPGQPYGLNPAKDDLLALRDAGVINLHYDANEDLKQPVRRDPTGKPYIDKPMGASELRSKGVTPNPSALGANDPWAMLAWLLDSGKLTEQQVLQASKGAMDSGAESDILSKVEEPKSNFEVI